jgi:hypothetical protein
MKSIFFFAVLITASSLFAAEKRVKDLTKTATTPNADDYLVIDGAAAGTRKILTNNIVAKVAGGVATYGSSTQTPVIGVDVNGRIVTISNVTTAASSGGGSLTSVTAGDLSPLFTTSETSGETAAITFTGVTQVANRVYAGPATGSAALPTFRAIVDADLPATAVTAGIYGNATHVPQITISANGRVTLGANVSISPTNMVTGSGLISGNIIVGAGSSAVGTSAIAISGANISTAGNVTANIITGNNLTVTDFVTTNFTVSGNVSGFSKEVFLHLDALADSMNRGVIYVTSAVTVKNLKGVHTGSGLSSPSIVLTFKHGTDRTSGSTIEAVTVTSSTTGTADDGTLTDATVPAGSWIWVETSGKSGTTADLELVVRYTHD